LEQGNGHQFGLQFDNCFSECRDPYACSIHGEAKGVSTQKDDILAQADLVAIPNVKRRL
jgi:hypothetical protein